MDYQSKSKEELINDLLELQQKYLSSIKSFEAEIAEHKQIVEDLEKKDSLMQAIIDETTDAIYVKDINGKYLLFNRAAEIITGKKSEDVLRKDDNFLFPAEEAKALMDGDKKVIEDGIIKTYEESVTSAQGQKSTFLSTKGPVFSKNGRPFGLFGIARNITERKQVEESLRKSEDLFNKAFHGSPSPMTIARRVDGEYIAANDSFLRLIELSREEVIGKKGHELGLIDPSARAKLLKALQETGRIHNIEVLANSKSGKPLYLLTSIENTELAGIECTIATMLDITERKQAELLLQIKTQEIETQNEEYQQINEELNQTNDELYLAKERAEESEETYRMLFESINDAVFISELSDNGNLGKFIKVNDIACKRLGYTQDELLNKTPTDINSEKAKQEINPKIQKLFKSKHAIIETEHVTKDGKVIPVEISTKIAQFKGKTIIHSIARNITERNQAAEALRQSEAKFRKAFFTNPDAITINRLNDGMYISANNGFTQIFDYSEDDIIGKTSRDINIWHNYDDRSKFVQLLQTDGSVANFETKFNSKNGKIIDALVFSTIIELEGVQHSLTITRDITEQKRAEQDLKANRDLLLNLARLVPGVIYQYRLYPDGRSAFPYSSPGMFTIYEVTPEEVQYDATPVFSRLHPDDFDNVVKLITESAENLNTFYCEFRVNLPGQGIRWRWSQAHPIRLDDGSILWHGIISDITERKEAEIQLKERNEKIKAQNEGYLQLNEELIQTNKELHKAKEHAEQSDRLKTAFLQNMSHEIRTPMNAIMGFAELLADQFNNKIKLAEFSRIINQRCADLLEIINEVLDIAKIESGQLHINIEEFKLASLFSELSVFFKEFQKKQGKHNIEFNIKAQCDASSSIILTDKVKLKQILINLIGNAFKFTNKGEIQAGCKLDNSNHLLFFVSDTGIGIAPDKQNFIFERFAQLEQSPGHLYGGTGLGLSIVKGLIDLLGGKIWLESELGKGSTFYFSLPYEMVGYLSHERLLNGVPVRYDFSNKTILIVEDDQFNADYLKEALDGTGFKIIHSTYGSDAIQIAKSQKLDIVLMDIRLPDMDGYMVTLLIKKINPDLKIIAQTAYASHEDREKAINAGCNDYISKPVKRDLLLSIIDKQLSKF